MAHRGAQQGVAEGHNSPARARWDAGEPAASGTAEETSPNRDGSQEGPQSKSRGRQGGVTSE